VVSVITGNPGATDGRRAVAGFGAAHRRNRLGHVGILEFRQPRLGRELFGRQPRLLIGKRLLRGADLRLHSGGAIEGALQGGNAGFDVRRVARENIVLERVDDAEDVGRVAALGDEAPVVGHLGAARAIDVHRNRRGVPLIRGDRPIGVPAERRRRRGRARKDVDAAYVRIQIGKERIANAVQVPRGGFALRRRGRVAERAGRGGLRLRQFLDDVAQHGVDHGQSRRARVGSARVAVDGAESGVFGNGGAGRGRVVARHLEPPARAHTPLLKGELLGRALNIGQGVTESRLKGDAHR
jgi:hypothetical protein